jgi:hypothetical protein
MAQLLTMTVATVVLATLRARARQAVHSSIVFMFRKNTGHYRELIEKRANVQNYNVNRQRRKLRIPIACMDICNLRAV